MSRDTGGVLRTVDLLWGKDTPRGTRGPRPGLDLEKITRAALAIADAEGINALSMQRVAGDLGYTTMSIYNYVPGKDQLIELMIDAATPPPPQPQVGDTWREELERWVRATWELYHAHPWVLKVPTLNPPLGPHQLAWFEAALQALIRSGLAGGEVLSLGLYVIGSVRGQAAMALDLTTATSAQETADIAEAMSRVITADRFPALHAVSTPSSTEEYGAAGQRLMELEFGLKLLLDGVEAYVEHRSSAAVIPHTAR
ncbi:AcrR family transcriptional regulator [Allocatelliglobosispora scoriae]|uniref:AcrR family transcriptional regulator n=1 Tax=Allocatelliglobosispora scoriae TaxID=643052 RepID=A0A841BKS8_9ACTN|nr:TetR/AcrR family transcriptional regulator C-terminal domain-containing protein [Allocatelliglobosispora scoriae]MBB5867603.1 AcrR family transcriptional regulator [Allocatelliglobosispora scoriae]